MKRTPFLKFALANDPDEQELEELAPETEGGKNIDASEDVIEEDL